MEKQSSNKTMYLVGGIIVLLLIGAGIGYKVMHHNKNAAMMATAPTATASPTVMLSPTTAAGLSNKSDTSNQQLNQDAQSIENSMNQLNQDQTTAGQTINNQSADIPQQ